MHSAHGRQAQILAQRRPLEEAPTVRCSMPSRGDGHYCYSVQCIHARIRAKKQYSNGECTWQPQQQKTASWARLRLLVKKRGSAVPVRGSCGVHAKRCGASPLHRTVDLGKVCRCATVSSRYCTRVNFATRGVRISEAIKHDAVARGSHSHDTTGSPPTLPADGRTPYSRPLLLI